MLRNVVRKQRDATTALCDANFVLIREILQREGSYRRISFQPPYQWRANICDVYRYMCGCASCKCRRQKCSISRSGKPVQHSEQSMQEKRLKFLTVSAYAPEVSIRQPNPKYIAWGAVFVVPARVEVLQRCCNGVTMVLQWCHHGVTMKLQRCYNGSTMVVEVLQRYCHDLSKGCHWRDRGKGDCVTAV
jgi:hypothetical protein